MGAGHRNEHICARKPWVWTRTRRVKPWHFKHRGGGGGGYVMQFHVFLHTAKVPEPQALQGMISMYCCNSKMRWVMTAMISRRARHVGQEAWKLH